MLRAMLRAMLRGCTAILAWLGILLGGCGRAPAPPTRHITSLHLLGVYTAEARSLAVEFEQKTGIRVEVIGASIGALREKELTDLLTRGGNFDVMQVPYQWDGEILPRLRPLDDVLPRIAPDLADFIPGVRTNCGQWGEQIYGLPVACDAITLLYRTDIFAARAAEFQQARGRALTPPKTWEEYVEIASFLDAESIYGNVIMGGDQIYTIWSGILYGMGGQPVDENWQPQVNSEAGIRSLKLFKEMFKYAPPRSESIGVPEANRLFLQGRGAMYLAWPSLVWSQIQDTNICKIAGKIGAAVIPGGRPQLSAWSLGINPACRDFDAASQWLAFFVNETNSKRLLLQYGKGSPRLSTYADPDCRRECFYLPALLDSLAGLHARFRVPPSPELTDYLDQELINVIREQSAPQVALDRAAARWREILIQAGYLRD